VIFPGDLPATRGEALAIALDAYATLTLAGEAVSDEWTYVAALAAAGRSRLARAAGPRPDALLPREVATAVVVVALEAGRIADPHRAIDWLSTFPAVVELALAGPGDGAAAPSPDRAGGAGGAHPGA